MEVGDGQVQSAISVQIPHSDRNWYISRGEILRSLEGAIPVPDETVAPSIADRIVVDEVQPQRARSRDSVDRYRVRRSCTGHHQRPRSDRYPRTGDRYEVRRSTPVTDSLNVTMNRGLAAFAPGCVGSGTMEATRGAIVSTARV